MMNRRNFGGQSGVIVDVCAKHGTWFEAGELPRALEFVESGGLTRARAKAQEQERERSSREHPKEDARYASIGVPRRGEEPSAHSIGSAVVDFLTDLFDEFN
jgi:Zn-finger nucleic acid-binding protein